MNRLCDTDRWKQSWFVSLTCVEKTAWQYVYDHCDNAGIWDPGVMKIATLSIVGEQNESIDWKAFQKKLSFRLEILTSGLWWDRLFISEQCKGPLSEKFNHQPHQFIIRLLVKYGLIERYRDIERSLFGASNFSVPMIALPKQPAAPPLPKQSSLELPAVQVKDKAVEVLMFLNEKSRRNFAIDSKEHLRVINRALSEVAGDVNGVKTMISRAVEIWHGTRFEEYLQPSTLFGPGKFRERYDKRNEPIPNQKPSTAAKANDHKSGFFSKDKPDNTRPVRAQNKASG